MKTAFLIKSSHLILKLVSTETFKTKMKQDLSFFFTALNVCQSVGGSNMCKRKTRPLSHGVFCFWSFWSELNKRFSPHQAAL